MSNLALKKVYGHQAKLLIVDDDASLRSLVRIRLTNQGYLVNEAADGHQAISTFKIEQPDIILMDANMPGIDGFESIIEIKKLPEAKHTPIIMISGLEDDGSVDRAFGVGATEYITKPICWPLLIHRLANICEAMQAESVIVQAKLDADKANRSKSEFLSNMSHELRTPMHAILNFAAMGMVKVDTATTSKLNRYFSRIETSGKRLLMLLNDLLDLSKLEAGAIEYEIKKRDIQPVVKAVISELSGLVSEKDISLEIESPQVSTYAFIDDERILHVIQNLVANAVKFTPHGSSIKISYGNAKLPAKEGESKRPALLMTVADQGIGIPEEELTTIFDKFVQSSKSNTGAGGTGLGLAISKEIVESHHGFLYAENNEDGGASLHLLLPVSDDG